jgi:hypothetical protein
VYAARCQGSSCHVSVPRRTQSKWRDEDDDGDDDQFGTLRSSEPAPEAAPEPAPQAGVDTNIHHTVVTLMVWIASPGLIDLMGDGGSSNPNAFEADFNPRVGAAPASSDGQCYHPSLPCTADLDRVLVDFGAFADSRATTAPANNEFAAFTSAYVAGMWRLGCLL